MTYYDMGVIPGVPGVTTRPAQAEDFMVEPILSVHAPIAELESAPEPIRAATAEQRSHNELRPVTFDDVIGQEEAKAMLRRMVAAAKRRQRPLDHALFIGPSGTGKTTLANVCANELGVQVTQLEAPVSADTLYELSQTMVDGDILFLDEIHQQAAQDRRGRSSNTQPEVLFSVMEDYTLPTSTGVVSFPRITIFGATTDEGALPDAFVNRFPLRPALSKYTVSDLETIAFVNGPPLDVRVGQPAARVFATASRGVPREVNNFVKIAASLTADGYVDDQLASEVLRFAGVTADGLTKDMQAMLTFLYQRCERRTQDGEKKYQASVSTIATAIGKSRDQKAVALRVEPYLIEQGYVQVGHGGRTLTDAGIVRALRLIRSEG
jgi:Holliday junction DNA helicase RuvB